jgi:hypothetical protein
MDMSGFVGSLMSLTCFKVMYIKTQPKDQLGNNGKSPYCTNGNQSKKFLNCSTGTTVLIDLGEGRQYYYKIR